MTWLPRRIVDLFNAMAAWYYRRKVGAAARQLGRPVSEQDGRRGFVILEIDGLAYDYLKAALRQGAMPYLARRVLRRKLRLDRWKCGLPSTTPASQAGILFGNNQDVPGFRWYDKATRSRTECKRPGDARAVQDRVSEGRTGLLRGGSSYTNMFDGGARLALFTLAAVGRDRLFENVRGFGFLALFAVSLVRVVKVLLLSLWTWGGYLGQRLRSLVAPSAREFTFWGPLNQIFDNVVFREVTTFSVMVDVYRGMPCIYAAYTGYDEIAHHFGADSSEALRALRGLDAQIRQIDRARTRYAARPYDLLILSDHGQAPSAPFRRAYGQTLQQFLAFHTGRPVREPEEGLGGDQGAAARVHSLLDELRGLEERPRRPLSAQLLRTARQRLEQQLRSPAPVLEWDLERREDVVVCNSGSLSHVYFNVTIRSMDLSEVTAIYPTLLETLVAHEGIGLVVGREGAEVVIAAREGTLWTGPEGRRWQGAHPLLHYPDADWVEEQLARLARFPHSGDILLFGAWDGQRVVSFEDQVATHGGLGGPQVYPFLATSAGAFLDPLQVEDAEELYSRLMDAYGDPATPGDGP